MASSLRPSTSNRRARSSSPAGHSGYRAEALDHLAGLTKLQGVRGICLNQELAGPEELCVAALGPFHRDELLQATLDFGRLLLLFGQLAIGEQQIQIGGVRSRSGHRVPCGPSANRARQDSIGPGSVARQIARLEKACRNRFERVSAPHRTSCGWRPNGASIRTCSGATVFSHAAMVRSASSCSSSRSKAMAIEGNTLLCAFSSSLMFR